MFGTASLQGEDFRFLKKTIQSSYKKRSILSLCDGPHKLDFIAGRKTEEEGNSRPLSADRI